MRYVRDWLALRRAAAGELISVANLVGSPVRDGSGRRVGRVQDVVAHWEEGVGHPPVTGVLVRVGGSVGRVSVQDLQLRQHGVSLKSMPLVVSPADRHPGDVVLAHDVLDHQLVDVQGVQVVRAADVYLGGLGDSWELGGVDVGLRALLRRLLPRRRKCPSPVRAIDWSDLQAFVPRFPAGGGGAHDPAGAASTVGSSVQLAGAAADLHRLRPTEVTDLLNSLPRRKQAQLVGLTDAPTGLQALRALEPSTRDALLAELDDVDRARLADLLGPPPP